MSPTDHEDYRHQQDSLGEAANSAPKAAHNVLQVLASVRASYDKSVDNEPDLARLDPAIRAKFKALLSGAVVAVLDACGAASQSSLDRGLTVSVTQAAAADTESDELQFLGERKVAKSQQVARQKPCAQVREASKRRRHASEALVQSSSRHAHATHEAQSIRHKSPPGLSSPGSNPLASLAKVAPVAMSSRHRDSGYIPTAGNLEDWLNIDFPLFDYSRPLATSLDVLANQAEAVSQAEGNAKASRIIGQVPTPPSEPARKDAVPRRPVLDLPLGYM